MQQIKTEEFLLLSQHYPVLDVRSPGEYDHAHMPGAYSLPLFTDEERKVVGTIYKQEGKEQAIKAGLDYFGVKMRKMVEEAEKIAQDHKAQVPKIKFQITNSQTPNSNSEIPNAILVHCWRGGMRSAGVAWLLDLYGFKVHTLAGGYKAYRNWVLQQFNKSYPIKIIGGYTGSGKTEILKHMTGLKHPIIDLEGVAHHKGSAFGALGETKQPGQEMFENLLAQELNDVSGVLQPGDAIWIEDESRRIGLVNLPDAFWKTMQQSPLYFLDVPFEERLDYITGAYGKFKQEELVNAVMRIRKRLGGLNTKNAINHLLEGNCKESFRILLTYYDKFYGRDLENRKTLPTPMEVINCGQVDAKANYLKLIG